MAQFQVHRLTAGKTLVLDCQSDLLDPIDSRFVVPLIPLKDAPQPARKLNPVFSIGGEDYVMLTQAASAVHRRELGETVGSLAEHHIEIVGALNVLISGV
ncbi:CcdB family protein [Croceibacterium sp. LX-88]|uniref:Toxin CcdB n=1 Tax=Croceibacterium selenioxidans TaxID=2838833 RepID=A0ABS5W173_9SPHN|nr:CcdB family protein [Croceibacterium selenioxidans]MBT2133508.1 CcdB family protein [Croceibacterium selenioxidans]